MTRPVRFYAHLVCGHIRPCPETTNEGDYIECWHCEAKVKVERVREGTK